jgi:hypothetical protein
MDFLQGFNALPGVTPVMVLMWTVGLSVVVGMASYAIGKRAGDTVAGHPGVAGLDYSVHDLSADELENTIYSYNSLADGRYIDEDYFND